MENEEVLDYKNFHLFYKHLYSRLFKLINNIIDENQFNIIRIKNELQTFLDDYSYYIIQKKLIIKDEKEKGIDSEEVILSNLIEFSDFTKELNNYPSENYIKIYFDLAKVNYNILSLGTTQYKTLIQEYYLFFNEVLQIINKFVGITSINGFLPNIKSKNSAKTIGYANYDLFFMELENLKQKMSEQTHTIGLKNMVYARRCVLSVLIIFSPYFSKYNLYEKLVKGLNFDFIQDDDVLNEMRKAQEFSNLNDMGKEKAEKIRTKYINPLKMQISLIKRYISYEFGERDLNPKVKESGHMTRQMYKKMEDNKDNIVTPEILGYEILCCGVCKEEIDKCFFCEKKFKRQDKVLCDYLGIEHYCSSCFKNTDNIKRLS